MLLIELLIGDAADLRQREFADHPNGNDFRILFTNTEFAVFDK